LFEVELTFNDISGEWEIYFLIGNLFPFKGS